MNTSVILCMIISLFSFSTFGQSLNTLSKKWNIYNYANDAGLARTNVFHVDFDTSNTVWIATSDGLFKYDGYTFEKFTTENGLPSNFIRTINVVGKDSVWIGTEKGPAFYNGIEFTVYTDNIPESNRNIRRIYRDDQNTLWFCSDSWPLKNTIGGLACFKNNEFSVDTFFNNKYVVTIFQSKDGIYYVITDDAVFTRNKNTWEKLSSSLFENGDINWTSAHIVEQTDSDIIISTGTEIFALKNNVVSILKNIPNHRYGLIEYESSFMIFNIFNDNTGRLQFYDNEKMVNISDDISITKNYIEGVTADNNQNYWIFGYGTLTRYSPEDFEWQLFSDIKNPFFIELDGTIYLQNNFIEKPLINASIPSRGDLNNISGYNENSQLVWSKNYIYDINSDKKLPLPSLTQEQKIENLLKATDNIFAVVDTKNGKRIYSFENNTWSLVQLPNDFLVVRVVSNFNKTDLYIYIKNRTDGKDYICSINSIHDCIDVPDKIIAKFEGNLFIDSEENIYLYSDVGLFKFDIKTNTWDQFHNIIGEAVVKIYQQDNYLWFVCTSAMGGNDGLSRYSLKDHSIVNFRTDIIKSFNKSGKGDLLFGSNGRFYVVGKQTENLPFQINLPIDKEIHSIAFSNGTYWLSLGMEVLKFTPIKTGPTTLVSFQVKETTDDENVYIQFEGIRKFIPGILNNEFKYSFKINNEEWSELSPEKKITINRNMLKSGINSLEVKSVDVGLNQQSNPSVFNFRLKPIPLESRPYFIPVILVIIGLISFLGFLAFRSEQKFKKLVERKTHQLASSEKRFRAIVEGAPDPIFIQTNKCLAYLNQHAVELFGAKDGKELLGKPVLDFFHPDFHKAALERIKKLNEDKSIVHEPFEQILIQVDGHQIWVETKGEPIVYEGEDGGLVFVRDITYRKIAEKQLLEYQESLKLLTTELSLAEEKQRKEIAANIHDHLSQSLVISKMKISDLEKVTQFKKHKEELSVIKNHISEALENSRKITYDLSPPILYEMGLVETMYWLAEKIENENNMKVEFTSDTELLGLSEGKLILLYRSIQELIYNVIKHSGASNLSIQFITVNKGLEIILLDNGKGFDLLELEKKKSKTKSFGLFAVKERIQNLGGQFQIDSKSGKGTVARIYIPLEPSKTENNGN